MGPAGSDDLAAIHRRHARTEAVPTLAHELARLVGALHGSCLRSFDGDIRYPEPFPSAEAFGARPISIGYKARSQEPEPPEFGLGL